ncbi:hypothetical protein Nepgr_027177 [Nepenthes gracilis]|uniref:Uncharacterized protein n=1 Tax=Nepenthes gracilis TaxID=150966 RepID=A0AAD3Y2V1_NEPGR|nr:hypothetical protein Nepgr_027177 [Nepenthes gracilis]
MASFTIGTRLEVSVQLPPPENLTVDFKPSVVNDSLLVLPEVSAPGNNGDLEGCSTRCDLVSSNQESLSSVLDDSSSGGQGLLQLSRVEVTEPGLADADLVSKDAQSLDVGGSHYSLEVPVGAHHILDSSSGNVDQLDGSIDGTHSAHSSLAHELVVPTPDSIKRLSRKYSLDDSPQEGDSSENIEAARDGYQQGKAQHCDSLTEGSAAEAKALQRPPTRNQNQFATHEVPIPAPSQRPNAARHLPFSSKQH